MVEELISHQFGGGSWSNAALMQFGHFSANAEDVMHVGSEASRDPTILEAKFETLTPFARHPAHDPPKPTLRFRTILPRAGS